MTVDLLNYKYSWFAKDYVVYDDIFETSKETFCMHMSNSPNLDMCNCSILNNILCCRLQNHLHYHNLKLQLDPVDLKDELNVEIEMQK